MAKFDLKKAILENKATFFSSLTEGQFSWMTQDTGQQIGSEEENTIPVYMFDDKGKYYYEPNYDGYGDFGGMDYYALLDMMNGGKGDRYRGIDLAFGNEKTASKVLFPALVTKPNEFNFKTHDFTKEAESDPNQSWYAPEEEEDFIDQNDEEVFGDNEDEEDDMMEGLNVEEMDVQNNDEVEEFLDGMINMSIPEDSEEGEEVKDVWEASEYADEDAYGEAAQEFINTHKHIMDQGGEITIEGNPDVTYKALPNGDIQYRLIVTLNEAKMYYHVLEDGGYGRIGHQGYYNTPEEAKKRADKLADMFPNSSFYVEASDSKDEPYNVTMEENKKLNKSKVEEAMMDVAKDMTTQETAGIAERFAKYMSNKEGYDFTVTAGSVEGPSFDLDVDGQEYEGGSYVILTNGDIVNMALPGNPVYGNTLMMDEAEKPNTKMKKSELKDKIKEMILKEMEDEKVVDVNDETPESEEDFLAELEGMLDEAKGDEEVTDDVTTDASTDAAPADDTETIDTTTTTEVNPDVKAVQDALTQAQAAAQKLGDGKLTDQIGNTITFFTRAHVVEKGAVAENLNESMFPMLKRILK